MKHKTIKFLVNEKPKIAMAVKKTLTRVIIFVENFLVKRSEKRLEIIVQAEIIIVTIPI